MKILVLAAYIYNNNLSSFTKNHTGFGYMVYDIVDSISCSEDVYVLTNVITDQLKFNNMNFVRHKWSDIFCNLRFRDIFTAVFEFFACGCDVKSIYYELDNGYVEKVIRTLKPDIVHIHGLSNRTKSLLKICKKTKLPFLVTLHAMIGISKEVLASQRMKKYEGAFLRKAEIENIPVSLISDGMKQQCKDYYGIKKTDNIKVITNGIEININTNVNYDVRGKYGFSRDIKILLCVGNITKRKNQVQIIRSYGLLPDEAKKKIKVLMLGKICDEAIAKSIEEAGLQNDIILCGAIDRDEVKEYYAQADYTILASISEGFGLSIVEGFAFGLPSLTFDDIDAVSDLYDERAMITVKERTDQALANGIEKMHAKDWDKQYIKEYANRFSITSMAEKYIDYYHEIINKREEKVRD